MTYEEAKKWLGKQSHHFNTIEEAELDQECRAIINEALEKQIPKKPLHLHKNYYCPVCKEDGWMLWDDAEPNDFDNFCCKCGQAIDWSDDK